MPKSKFDPVVKPVHVVESKALKDMSNSELVEWLEEEVRYNHYDYGLPGKPTIHSVDEIKEEIINRLEK